MDLVVHTFELCALTDPIHREKYVPYLSRTKASALSAKRYMKKTKAAQG